jgi:hypothetical protein
MLILPACQAPLPDPEKITAVQIRTAKGQKRLSLVDRTPRRRSGGVSLDSECAGEEQELESLKDDRWLRMSGWQVT